MLMYKSGFLQYSVQINIQLSKMFENFRKNAHFLLGIHWKDERTHKVA